MGLEWRIRTDRPSAIAHLVYVFVDSSNKPRHGGYLCFVAGYLIVHCSHSSYRSFSIIHLMDFPPSYRSWIRHGPLDPGQGGASADAAFRIGEGPVSDTTERYDRRMTV